MAETEQRRLDVEATLKADGFAVGAKQIEASSQTAGQAAVKLSDIIRKTGEAGAAATPSLSRTGDSVEKLKRTFIDGYAATQKAEQAINGISKAMAAGNLAGDELTRSIDGVIRRYGILAAESVASAKGTLQNAAAVEILNTRLKQQAAIRPAGDNDNNAQFRRQNLGYQLMDLGQGLAMGAPAAMILAQQGPQILQIYAGQGGVAAAFKDLTAILGGVARVAGPMIAAVAAGYGAYRLLASYSQEASMGVSELTRALAGQAAPINGLASSVSELTSIQKAYADALVLTATSQDASTRSIVANSELEFNAKKALLELELKRQEASIALQQSEMAIANLRLRQSVSAQVNTNLNLEARGFSDPRAGSIPFVRVPDEITGVQKTLDTIANNPAADKIVEIRSNLTLTQLAVEKLREGLRQVFNGGGDAGPSFPNGVPVPTPRPAFELEGDDASTKAANKAQSAYASLIRTADQRIAQMQNEMSIVGQSTNMQAQLRAEFEAEAQYREQIARDGAEFNQAELDSLKQKAAALAAINAQLSAQKFDQGQRDQIQQLQLEASLIGATAQERARATAVYQAEQKMRQDGLSLLDAEADRRRAVATATADARLEIERQSAAYAAAQQAGGQLIDQMFVGTGSIEDRLKSMANTLLTTFQQLAVANPLKNALTGTNLPTLSDLFSGRPSMPGATSTAMMTVKAGTVMLNGGLPGLTNGGGLGELLGLGANTPTPTGNIADYIKQAALKRGIDPATALRVAQSEGGLESWNLQSGYMKNGVREQSFGPFQLYKGGGLGNEFMNRTGFDPALAQNGPAGVDFALDHAKNNGWSAWNGAKKAGINQWDGIDRSAQAANQNLLKLSNTTTSAANDISTLGQNSFDAGKSLTDVFGQGANTSLNKFPVAPQQMNMPSQTPGGGNFFTQLLSSLFGFGGGGGGSVGGGFSGAAGLAPSSAELVSMPRVAHSAPNYRPPDVNNGGSSGRTKVDVGVSVDKNGNLQAYVRNISHEVSNENTRSALASYDQNHLPGRMKQIAADPLAMG